VRILIADAEGPRAKGLAEACLARGHSVERVNQGAAALELVLERTLELVICPLDLPVIDGARLAEILGSNPRTRDVSFLFLIKDELDAPFSLDARHATVGAPWHHESVLEHVDAVLERSVRLGEIRSNVEVEGKLSQVAIMDLLQLFQMNRKSGVVRITRQGGSKADTVALRGGHIVDASVALADGSQVVGEKALYRILTWKEGRFEFAPGEVPEGRISKPTRELLLEGLGQIDEWQQRRSELPAEDTQLRVAVDRAQVLSQVHPHVSRVVDAVEAHGRVGDIVDRCSLPDFEVLRVLSELLEREFVAVEVSRTQPSRPEAPEERFFTPIQERRLREWAAAERPPAGSVLKVVVIGPQPATLQSFNEVLRQLPDFRSSPRLEQDPRRLGSLATLGQFLLAEGLSVRVLALSADPLYAPLWDVAAHGMLGAIVVSDGSSGAESSEAAFTRLAERNPRALLRLRLAASESAPASKEAAQARAAAEGSAEFELPAAPGPERVAVLRNLFARLVP